MITNIGHPAIRVSDLDRSLAFYTGILGLREAFRLPNAEGGVGAVYLYVAPNQFVELFPGGVAGARPTFEEVGYQHLCYVVEDALAAMEEMREKGAPIDGKFRIGTAKCPLFMTHDPDGNVIEIMELPPESLQAQATRRFTASNL